MAKKKHTYQFEVVLSVANYRDDDSDELAFTDCKKDFDAATDMAWSELKEAKVPVGIRKKVTIQSVEFVEFDSGNSSHAGGYFLAEISGSKKDVATVEELHTKWMEGIPA